VANTRSPAPAQAHRIARRVPIRVSDADQRMMHAIERFIISYEGDNLLHDIELMFSRRELSRFLAYCRARDPLRWHPVGGSA
jgi:hypothetical protein